jgi:glucose-1-phosphate thymidylyltransferase
VTGLYVYDNEVFDYIRKCNPNYIGRGELEITEVNNFYLKANKLSWAELDGYWLDAGTFDTLFAANSHWADKRKK